MHLYNKKIVVRESTKTHRFFPCEIFLFTKASLEVFLIKSVLKICCKFKGKHLCGSVISTKLLCNFIEIILQHKSSPANLLQIFRAPYYKNTFQGLLLCLERRREVMEAVAHEY